MISSSAFVDIPRCFVPHPKLRFQVFALHLSRNTGNLRTRSFYAWRVKDGGDKKGGEKSVTQNISRSSVLSAKGLRRTHKRRVRVAKLRFPDTMQVLAMKAEILLECVETKSS